MWGRSQLVAAPAVMMAARMATAGPGVAAGRCDPGRLAAPFFRGSGAARLPHRREVKLRSIPVQPLFATTLTSRDARIAALPHLIGIAGAAPVITRSASPHARARAAPVSTRA